MWIIFQNLNRTLFSEIFVRFVYLLGMIADQNFYDIYFIYFYPTASAMVYGRRQNFVIAEHSAMAEGKNCAYGPTLQGTEMAEPACQNLEQDAGWDAGRDGTRF